MRRAIRTVAIALVIVLTLVTACAVERAPATEAANRACELRTPGSFQRATQSARPGRPESDRLPSGFPVHELSRDGKGDSTVQTPRGTRLVVPTGYLSGCVTEPTTAPMKGDVVCVRGASVFGQVATGAFAAAVIQPPARVRVLDANGRDVWVTEYGSHRYTLVYYDWGLRPASAEVVITTAAWLRIKTRSGC